MLSSGTVSPAAAKAARATAMRLSRLRWAWARRGRCVAAVSADADSGGLKAEEPPVLLYSQSEIAEEPPLSLTSYVDGDPHDLQQPPFRRAAGRRPSARRHRSVRRAHRLPRRLRHRTAR